MESIKASIRKLNDQRLGAFGEYLFGITVPGAVRVNGAGADFEVPGLDRLVDVKATWQHIGRDRPTDGRLQAVGQTNPEEIRANVIFYRDVVSLHYDDAPITLFAWDEVDAHFSAWLNKTGKKLSSHRVVAPHERERGFNWNLWHVKHWATAIAETGRSYKDLSGKERNAIIQRVADEYERLHPDDPKGGIRNTLAAGIVFGGAKTIRPTWINIKLYAAAYIAKVIRERELNARLLAMLVNGALHPEGKQLRETLDATLAEAGYRLHEV